MFDLGAGPSTGWADRVWARRALWLRADIVGATAVVLVVVVAAWLWWRPSSSAEPPARIEDQLPLATVPELPAIEVHVHAAGAVAEPGLYRLPGGARVADLLDAAGGVVADADLDRVNLAAALVDGAQLYVPRVGEPGVSMAGAASPVGGQTGPIDVNVAGAAELEALPGIGPTIAAAIVDHRERHGPFAAVEDLVEVTGIGPAKLDALSDLVVAG